jgi:hypothetical protein
MCSILIGSGRVQHTGWPPNWLVVSSATSFVAYPSKTLVSVKFSSSKSESLSYVAILGGGLVDVLRKISPVAERPAS